MAIMDTAIEPILKTKYNYLKKAIWLYFFLWIFEGALRKWILPSLANPLLVVRDPIAIYIVLRAIYVNVKFISSYIVLGSIFTLMSLVITLTFGHSNLFVGLYGARIMLLHFPLIFIIGSVFTREDVVNMGRVLLVLNILMTVIVYFQFTSPQTSFINVGIGGEGNAGFSGAMGYSRPSGTFSFTTALSVFYSAVAVFIFYFWLSKEYISKILLYTSTIALIIGLPLTISRGAVVGVILVGLFAIIAAVSSGRILFKLFIAGFAFYILFIGLQNFTTIFNLSTEVFMDRVDSANRSTGAGGGLKESILLRAVESFTEPIVDLMNQPIIVGKLGMGTNAGAKLLTGKVAFLVSEGELGRLGGEQGLLFGGGIIVLRIVFAISLAVNSWRLPQEEKLLPFILCGAACIAIAQGQWAQPSVLGYAIIMAGLVMASLNAKLKAE